MGSINIGEVGKGTKLIFDNYPWQVLEVNFVKPGKGSALYKCRLRNLLKNTIIDRTYKSGDGIDGADIRKGEGQFLYKDRTGYIFMDTESFEQYTLTETLVGEGAKFLQDGMEVNLTYWDETPIEVIPPQHVNLKVLYTEPAVRGNTAGNITKPATVEGGASVQVPAFIEPGETIRIDTRTGSYVERVRN